MKNKICRHEEFTVLKDNRYKECNKCGVWSGNRTHAHNYNCDYYHRNNTIVNGIPQRQWYWSIHKGIWDEVGIDFLNINRVLEFGCGTGLLLWSIYRKYNIECRGVESSFWAYNWQKEVHGFNNDYDIIYDSFEDIDKDSLGKFDLIYSCHVMEHLEDPMTIIESCYNMLNNNGKFFCIVPDKDHQGSLHVHRWTYDQRCLETWFDQAGFKNIKTIKTKPYNPPPMKNEYPGHYLHVFGTKEELRIDEDVL